MYGILPLLNFIRFMKRTITMVVFITTVISCNPNDNNNAQKNDLSSTLASTNLINSDSINIADCENLIRTLKDSVTLDKDLLFSYSTDFVNNTDSSQTAHLIMKLRRNYGDLNFVYLLLRGNYGCIDKNAKVIFVSKGDEKIEFNCHNKEDLCSSDPTLVFSLPLSSVSDRIKLSDISFCHKVRVLKNNKSFIDLVLNDNDRIELQRKVLCYRDQLKKI